MCHPLCARNHHVPVLRAACSYHQHNPSVGHEAPPHDFSRSEPAKAVRPVHAARLAMCPSCSPRFCLGKKLLNPKPSTLNCELARISLYAITISITPISPYLRPHKRSLTVFPCSTISRKFNCRDTACRVRSLREPRYKLYRKWYELRRKYIINNERTQSRTKAV